MKSIILAFFCLVVFTAHASEPFDACANPDIDRHWQNVLEKYPNDGLLLKLSSFRNGLCEMMENKNIDSNMASFMWEKALTAALMECTREQQEQRNFIRLFGTF